jgi:cell division septal protein FtsQ
MLSESNERSNDTKNLSSSEESLQRYLKIKKHSFITRLLVFLTLWGLIIGYFFTPLSKVGNPNIDGNRYLTNQDIIEISNERIKNLKEKLNQAKEL